MVSNINKIYNSKKNKTDPKPYPILKLEHVCRKIHLTYSCEGSY